MTTQSELKKASELAAKGDKAGARKILEPLTQSDPHNPKVWLTLFNALESPPEKYDCLKQALKASPKDESIQQKMKKYRATAEYRDYKAQVHQVAAVEKEKIHKEIEKKQSKGILGALKTFFEERF